MQWFKHDSNSTMDYKIKKLLIKYGAVGYAIYFHCLELIAGSINDNNITFELEHDSEIIADDLRITSSPEKSGKELVEEIMRYMVSLNLFEENNGHIFCFKLLKRLDTSMTSSTKLRTLITKAKSQERFLDSLENNHDTVMTNLDNNMQEKTRLEKTTQEEKRLKKTMNSSCEEPQEEKADVEALILNDSTEWQPSKSTYSEYERLYPNVDVVAEFRKMRAWCLSNPKKRKTKIGVHRFINSWLGKAQDNPYYNKQNQQGENDKFNHTAEEYRRGCDDPDKVAY